VKDLPRHGSPSITSTCRSPMFPDSAWMGGGTDLHAHMPTLHWHQ